MAGDRSQTARGLGAKSVLITDISDFRLKIAEDVGINYTLNPRTEDLSEGIEKVFGKNKADLIIDCVGASATINNAINNARKGTDIIVIGVFPEKPQVNFGLVQNNELRIHGSAMYQTNDFLKAIELIAGKKINLKPLMTKHFKFDDYSEAYSFLETEKDKSMKVFIDIHP